MENSIERFFKEAAAITDNPDDFVSTEQIKLHYSFFCHKQKIRPEGARVFINTIRTKYPEIQFLKIRPDHTGTPLNRWRYVKLLGI